MRIGLVKGIFPYNVLCVCCLICDTNTSMLYVPAFNRWWPSLSRRWPSSPRWRSTIGMFRFLLPAETTHVHSSRLNYWGSFKILVVICPTFPVFRFLTSKRNAVFVLFGIVYARLILLACIWRLTLAVNQDLLFQIDFWQSNSMYLKYLWRFSSP